MRLNQAVGIMQLTNTSAYKYKYHDKIYIIYSESENIFTIDVLL